MALKSGLWGKTKHTGKLLRHHVQMNHKQLYLSELPVILTGWLKFPLTHSHACPGV